MSINGWVDNLSISEWREINKLQNERAKAVYDCHAGVISADAAREIVARCNERIAVIAKEEKAG